MAAVGVDLLFVAWWLLQDAVKVGAYVCMDRFRSLQASERSRPRAGGAGEDADESGKAILRRRRWCEGGERTARAATSEARGAGPSMMRILGDTNFVRGDWPDRERQEAHISLFRTRRRIPPLNLLTLFSYLCFQSIVFPSTNRGNSLSRLGVAKPRTLSSKTGSFGGSSPF